MKSSRPFDYTNKEAKDSDKAFQDSLSKQGYNTLKVEWEAKLKESYKATGDVDIEKPSGALKTYDRRTLAWENREIILEYFLKLDQYLTKNGNIDQLDRQTLELYSAGKRIKYITEVTHRSDAWVRSTIRKYKRMILEGYLVRGKDVDKAFNK